MSDSIECRSRLRIQVHAECEAMAQYSLMRGLTLPTGVLAALERERDYRGRCGVDAKEASLEAALPEAVLPEAALPEAAPSVDELAEAHARLAQLVSPASPSGVRFLTHVDPSHAVLGNTPLTRRLMMVAMVALVGLVLTASSPLVDGSPHAGSLIGSSGLSLLVNQLFFLCAATLGAAFYGLFLAQRYINSGTYEPFHEPSYWVRLVLGMISGLLLASLLEVGELDPMRGLSRPLMALLGGFSASLVRRILDRTVETIAALVEGQPAKPVSSVPALASRPSGSAGTP